MFQHFDYGVLSVFVVSVLKNLFYCYFFTCLAIGAEVDDSESPFSSDAFDVEASCELFELLSLHCWETDFYDLVGLCS